MSSEAVIALMYKNRSRIPGPRMFKFCSSTKIGIEFPLDLRQPHLHLSYYGTELYCTFVLELSVLAFACNLAK